MKNIIEKVAGSRKHSRVKSAQHSNKPICNYTNNYYGDQVCVDCLVSKKAPAV